VLNVERCHIDVLTFCYKRRFKWDIDCTCNAAMFKTR